MYLLRALAAVGWIFFLGIFSAQANEPLSGVSPCRIAFQSSPSISLRVDPALCPTCHFQPHAPDAALTHILHHFLAPHETLVEKLRANSEDGRVLSTTVFPAEVQWEDIFRSLKMGSYEDFRPDARMMRLLEDGAWPQGPALPQTIGLNGRALIHHELYELKVVICVVHACQVEGAWVARGEIVTVYPICGPGVQSIRARSGRADLKIESKLCRI